MMMVRDRQSDRPTDGLGENL